MIAAFLCGLMYGALAYRAWRVKPITLKGEVESWEDPAHYGKGWGTLPAHGTFAISPNVPGITIDGIPFDVWQQQFEPTTARDM